MPAAEGRCLDFGKYKRKEVSIMPEDISALSERLSRLEARLGVPAKSALRVSGAKIAAGRKEALGLQDSRATAAFAEAVEALANKADVLVEFDIKQVVGPGQVASVCCCCCCCVS